MSDYADQSQRIWDEQEAEAEGASTQADALYALMMESPGDREHALQELTLSGQLHDVIMLTISDQAEFGRIINERIEEYMRVRAHEICGLYNNDKKKPENDTIELKRVC